MIDTVKWDWITLIIYLFIAFFTSFLLKIAIECKNSNSSIVIFKKNINYKYLCYFFIYLVLIIFMITRKITLSLGGTDTPRYIELFNNSKYINFNIISILKFSGWEYLFFNLMFFVKTIGLSYTFFSFIIYSIIICCYLWYFDKNLTDSKKWYISLLFILPFLKSMNIVRNIFAAAITLISFQKIKEEKYLQAIIFCLIAYLNHYLSIFVFGFIFFCKFIPIKWYNTRKKYIIISFSCLLIAVLSTPLLIKLLSLTRYFGYIDKIQFSIFGYIPYIFIYIFILFNYKEFIEDLINKKQYIYYKMVVFLSICVPFFTMLNGTYRLLLFFELPRFIMYGTLLDIFQNKIEKYLIKMKILKKYDSKKFKVVFNIICIFVYVVWISFRIWRMYEDSHIMPYISNLFF